MLKRIIAIWFLLLYLFSLAGNSLVIDRLLQRHDRLRLQDIDAGNYSSVHLEEFRIPVHTPYYSSSVDFQRFYGNFERDGRHYNFVMRKVINDTIFLLCLADERGSALREAKTRLSLFASGRDAAASSQKNETTPAKKAGSLQDYFQPFYQIVKTWQEAVKPGPCQAFQPELMTCYIKPPVKPPSAVNLFDLMSPAGSSLHACM